jgi:hypothetical protein
MRGGRAAILCLALLHPTAATATERSVMLFGGLSTMNDWTELWQPRELEFARAGLVGVAGAVEWPIAGTSVAIGAEAQIVKHLGAQTNWEVNLPVVVRYTPARAVGSLESLAFALGLSWASEPPAIEVAREGESRRAHVYWAAELAFGTAREDRDVVFRLHHRSTGYGLFGDGGSTNSFVAGIRQTF